MEYRKLPHGGEMFSTLGLGLGAIQKSSGDEIEATIRLAIDNGINFFDLCAGGGNVYAPFGRAIAGRRDKVYTQMHFGAVYNEKNEYAWSRDMAEIRRTFDWELKTMGTDYTDMGYLHCVDEDEDYDALISAGVLDLIKSLKRDGVVRHIGFSSHTPAVARRILETGIIDMFMFSINPAYDFADNKADIRLSEDRAAFYRECAQAGVGISVMKAFHGGKLLDDSTSPLGHALSKYQCMQYALDRPGVLTVLPGVRGLSDLKDLLGFISADDAEKDYSVIGGYTARDVEGSCVYCNHCQPCPAGIDVGLVNKYYDLALSGDAMARDHYSKLTVNADSCLHCGHCDGQCPFHVAQSDRMSDIAAYFAR